MERKTPTIVAGALAAALALGGVGIAAADTNGSSASNGATGSQAGEQDPSYTGSVVAPKDNGTEGNDTEASEVDEATGLQALATTTPREAEDAALAAVPGEAVAVELDNENGYVVYSVEVTGADGKTTDVKVDAGNGTVLSQDSEDGSEADEG